MSSEGMQTLTRDENESISITSIILVAISVILLASALSFWRFVKYVKANPSLERSIDLRLRGEFQSFKIDKAAQQLLVKKLAVIPGISPTRICIAKLKVRCLPA